MRKAAEELGYINTIGHVIKMTAVISAVKRDNKTYRPIRVNPAEKCHSIPDTVLMSTPF